MCIHHINFHLPCGHTTQSPNRLEYCNPVLRALQFYHDQPRRARAAEGRCFGLDCMKPPRPCGGDRIDPLRNVTIVSGPSTPASPANTTTTTNNLPYPIPTNNPTVATIHPAKPPTWTPAMTTMAKTLFANGEDIHSVTLLLETEFPILVDGVQESWLHHLHSCFHAHGALTFVPEQDLNNGHLAGDIVTQDVAWGCGRVHGEEKCAKGWENGYGGRAWCPVLHGGQMGMGAVGVMGEGHERAVQELHAQARMGRDLPLPLRNGIVEGAVADGEKISEPEVEGVVQEEEIKEPGRMMGRDYSWPLPNGVDDSCGNNDEKRGDGKKKPRMPGQDLPSPSLTGDEDKEKEEEKEGKVERMTKSQVLPDLSRGRGGFKREVEKRAVSMG